MNKITVSGMFYTMLAHSDGTAEHRESIWKETEKDFRTTLVISYEDWIEVRFAKKVFPNISSYCRNMVNAELYGELKTEISRGTGFTRNYIQAERILSWS
jgi:hypothetical protein